MSYYEPKKSMITHRGKIESKSPIHYDVSKKTSSIVLSEPLKLSKSEVLHTEPMAFKILKNGLIVFRTEKAHVAYKTKAVWGDGLYLGLDKEQVADMTTNPHSTVIEEPDMDSVKELKIPSGTILKEFDLENMSASEFNNFPRGNDLKKYILDKGYDGVILLTGGDLNLGGDQVIIYNSNIIDSILSIPKLFIGYRYNTTEIMSGRSGIFYTLHPQDRGDKPYILEFHNLLEVSEKEIEPFIGLPSEYLASKWFMNRDWIGEADKLDISDGQLMDREVAKEAVKRGYDGIKYGNSEIQDLRQL